MTRRAGAYNNPSHYHYRVQHTGDKHPTEYIVPAWEGADGGWTKFNDLRKAGGETIRQRECGMDCLSGQWDEQEQAA